MWVNVDDGFPAHHKVLKAGEQLGVNGRGRVVAVWLEVMCYANRHLTDGKITDSVARSLQLDRKPLEVLRVMSLKSIRLLERVKDGCKIHDYDEYQPSKKETEEKRRKERDRKKRVRATSARTDGGTIVVSATFPHGVPVGQDRASGDPGPTRPDPARPGPVELVEPDQDQRADAPDVNASFATLEKLAHQAWAEHPNDPKNALKDLAAKYKIPYRADVIERALASAEVQRRRKA